MTRTLRSAILAAGIGLAVSPVFAQGFGRTDIWDIAIGSSVADIPADFIDTACGTNGGPPSRVLASFADYAQCPADGNGLHEVYFRYDDEMEYIARAMEQEKQIQIYRGTQIYDYPIMVSYLFDDAGVLKGLRIITDPRDTEIRNRNEFWTMGNFLKQRFGNETWDCLDLPAADGENPVGSYFIKNHCEKVADGRHLIIEQQFLHKKGQHFINPITGVAEPNAFDSWARFEMYDDDIDLAVVTGRVAQAPATAPVAEEQH